MLKYVIFGCATPLLFHFLMFRGDELISFAINNPSGPLNALFISSLYLSLFLSIAKKKPWMILPLLFIIKYSVDDMYLTSYSRESLTARTQLTDKYVVITGGNSGVGYGTATTLALLGADVTIACRSPQRCTLAANKIFAETSKRVGTMPLDLADYASIDSFVKSFVKSKQGKPIDYLFNNAGFATPPPGPTTYTAEGLELGLGSMHFGHYYLTRELQQANAVTRDTRIVNTASAAALMGSFDPSLFLDDGEGDLRGEATATSEFKMYARAKLANFLFTRSLADRGYRACSMHIGAVATSIWDVPAIAIKGEDWGPSVQRVVDSYAAAIMRDLEEGSRGMMRCALDDASVVGNGAYLDGAGGVREDSLLTAAMGDKKLRDRLWEVSEARWEKLKQ
jgi:NAD(P)-dependent dehydrogenase (short-subunit alcohol dehydrogenase family)